jgi:hypothetical protein
MVEIIITNHLHLNHLMILFDVFNVYVK